MLYLSGHVSAALARQRNIGFMLSAKMGNRPPAGSPWAIDSGTYSTRREVWLDYEFGDCDGDCADCAKRERAELRKAEREGRPAESVYRVYHPGSYADKLRRHRIHVDRCLFAVIPDRVGDHGETVANLSVVQDMKLMGYPIALPIQPGATPERLRELPLDLLDWLFLGGDDEHQRAVAQWLPAFAHEHGLKAHRGRVNRRQRIFDTAALGFDSADGTIAAFGPDTNTPVLIETMRRLAAGETGAPELPR